MERGKKNGLQKIGEGFVYTIRGNKYALDLEALNKFCFPNSKTSDDGHELTESYEWDDETQQLMLSGKIVRDYSQGGSQANMVTYDIVKLLIERLMDNASLTEEFDMDFSTSLAMNTLIKYGILVKV